MIVRFGGLFLIFCFDFFQSNNIDNILYAFKIQSANEMSKYLHEQVAMRDLDGNTFTASKAQAVLLLRKFFSEHPATNFNTDHTGKSNDEKLFIICTYASKNGDFRILMRAKKFNGHYLLAHIEFYAK
jgi:hypothetical protein